MPITSPRSAPFAIISLKDIPAYFVPFAAFSSAFAPFVPSFPSSTKADLSCVVAWAVGVPFAVISAREAPTCSKDTPIAAAVGVTFARLAPSSPTVVMPKF